MEGGIPEQWRKLPKNGVRLKKTNENRLDDRRRSYI